MRWGKGFFKSDAQSRTPLKSAIESPPPNTYDKPASDVDTRTGHAAKCCHFL